jgi:uncharacterized protein YbjT (DUF2867 family)
MKKQGLTAIVIGATGLVGSSLLQQLLEDSRYDGVITLSRKRIPDPLTKHHNYIADLFDPSTYREQMEGDHLFICTGTTKDKTPDPKEYYRIEHDLPLQVAQVALEKGIDTVAVVSALGADPDSRFEYNRGKGAMERDIEKLGFKHCYFAQPAIIGGERDEKRTFESLWKSFQKIIDPLLIGSLKKYRTIEPGVISQAMIEVAVNGYPKIRIESDELKNVVSMES